LFKIDVPHPLSGRRFTTRTEAAKFARAFDLNPRRIVEVGAAPFVTRPRRRPRLVEESN